MIKFDPIYGIGTTTRAERRHRILAGLVADVLIGIVLYIGLATATQKPYAWWAWLPLLLFAFLGVLNVVSVRARVMFHHICWSPVPPVEWFDLLLMNRRLLTEKCGTVLRARLSEAVQVRQFRVLDDMICCDDSTRNMHGVLALALIESEITLAPESNPLIVKKYHHPIVLKDDYEWHVSAILIEVENQSAKDQLLALDVTNLNVTSIVA